MFKVLRKFKISKSNAAKLAVLSLTLFLIFAFGYRQGIEKTEEANAVGPWTHPDITINSINDQTLWDLTGESGYPHGKAIRKGKLTFTISNFKPVQWSQTNEGFHIVEMIDQANGITGYETRNYFFFTRVANDASKPVELRARMNCQWSEAYSGKNNIFGSTSDHHFDAELYWGYGSDRTTATFKLTGKNAADNPTGNSYIVTSDLGVDFLARQPTVIFGKALNSSVFAALPATYSDIRMTPIEFEDTIGLPDDMCPQEETLDNVNNEPTEDPSYEPDDPNYGESSCLGISEEQVPDPVELAEEPFEFNDLNLDWLWEFDIAKNWMEGYEMRMQGPPQLSMTITPTNPAEGEEVTIMPQATNFRTRTGAGGSRLYQGIWVRSLDGKDDSHIAVSGSSLINNYTGYVLYNTVGAGGKPPHTVEGTYLSNNSGTGTGCNDFTRVPEVDTDGDGMDDEWERLHFAETSKCGLGGNEPCPSDIDSQAFLAAVDADGDPDADGAPATRFQKNEESDDGRYMTILPYMRKTTGSRDSFTVSPERYIVGNYDRAGLNDGYSVHNWDAFTNWQEYVAGTDPLNADTDGDGVQDEQDLYGEGMRGGVTWIARGDPEDEAETLGIVTGINFRKDVAIVANQQKIYMGDGSSQGNLSVTIGASQDNLAIGDPVEFSATTSGSASGDNSSVNFDWGIEVGNQRVSVCDQIEPGDTPRCGLGKDAWDFTFTQEMAEQMNQNYGFEIGDPIKIYVDATDTITGKQAYGEKKFFLGENLGLKIEGCYSTMQANPSDRVECGCYTTPGAQGDVVCALDGEIVRVQVESGYDNPSELEELLFEWTLDGEKQLKASGEGYQEFDVAGGGSSAIKRNAFVFRAGRSGDQPNEVSLTISNIDTGKRVDGGFLPVAAGETFTDISVAGMTTGGENYFTIGNEGSYTILGDIYNVYDQASYSYKFLLDGQVIGSGSETYDSGSIPNRQEISIDASGLSLGSHEVEMNVVGISQNERRFTGTGYVIIKVEDQGTATAFMERTRAMASAMGSAMASGIQIMGVAGVAFAGLYGGLRLFDKSGIF